MTVVVKTDTKGRPYALESEVKEGDILIPDGGFIGDPEYCTEETNGDYGLEYYCIQKDEEKVVKKDHFGLYVDCCAGHHYLDGQYEEKAGYFPFYMGLYKK
jgi:hypothetical protein